jgi:hypothetical protein
MLQALMYKATEQFSEEKDADHLGCDTMVWVSGSECLKGTHSLHLV